MARASKERTVENAAETAATAAAPDAVETPGEASRASQIFATAEEAAATDLADVREELSELGQVVWEWVNEHCSNSPISRATEALNYLREHAVPDLINRIERI